MIWPDTAGLLAAWAATAAARRTNAVEPELENPTSHDAPLVVSPKRARQC